MASDDDFFLFRRFGALNSRTILWMQDRITRVENNLREIDELVENSKLADNLRNDSFRWDEKHLAQRAALMEELSRQLNHYSACLLSFRNASFTKGIDQYIEGYAKIRARPRAENRLISNVRNWLDREAIDPDETLFLEQTDDLTSIHHRTRSPLGAWLESCVQLHRSPFFRSKRSDNADLKAYGTVISSNSKFDLFTNTVIVLGGLGMLLAPLWWLEFVNDSVKKLGIMTGFICVFVGLMSIATVNRPGEVVAATAAYAAVLMVFMQVDNQGEKS